MVKVCERCGGPLDLLKPGRVPKYCSTRCRVAAYRAKVPTELRSRARWVEWKPTRRPSRDLDGQRVWKTTKRPVQPNGQPASSTNPSTWSRFAQVKDQPRKGFVLGDGIGCIDLDHCLVGGKLTAAAEAFLARMPKTYVEVSPSGDGLHVWGWLPERPGTKRVLDGLSVETYSVGRYITVTGRPFRGSVPRLGDLSTVR